MGKIQTHLFEQSHLQQDTLLSLETTQAQTTYLLDAMKAVSQAQFAAVREGMNWLSSLSVSPDSTAGSREYKSLAASQLQCSQALTAAVMNFVEQSNAVTRAYMDEKQKQMKNLVKA